jgi:hypothetical protein
MASSSPGSCSSSGELITCRARERSVLAAETDPIVTPLNEVGNVLSKPKLNKLDSFSHAFGSLPLQFESYILGCRYNSNPASHSDGLPESEHFESVCERT